MTLDRLTDTPLFRVQLHRTLDLESGRVRGVGRDSDEDEPFLIGSHSVVDDLVAGKRGVAVEDLDGSVGGRGRRGRGGSVAHPVVDGRLGHDTEGRRRDPLPERDILVHQVSLDLLLEFNVEDLELSLS